VIAPSRRFGLAISRKSWYCDGDRVFANLEPLNPHPIVRIAGCRNLGSPAPPTPPRPPIGVSHGMAAALFSPRRCPAPRFSPRYTADRAACSHAVASPEHGDQQAEAPRLFVRSGFEPYKSSSAADTGHPRSCRAAECKDPGQQPEPPHAIPACHARPCANSSGVARPSFMLARSRAARKL